MNHEVLTSWATPTNFIGFLLLPRFRAYLGASKRLLDSSRFHRESASIRFTLDVAVDRPLRLGRDRIHAHRCGTATQLLQAEVLDRIGLEALEASQRVPRDQELTLEVSRCPFQA